MINIKKFNSMPRDWLVALKIFLQINSDIVILKLKDTSLSLEKDGLQITLFTVGDLKQVMRELKAF